MNWAFVERTNPSIVNFVLVMCAIHWLTLIRQQENLAISRLTV